MKISEIPTREIKGIEYPNMPLVARNHPDSFVSSSAMVMSVLAVYAPDGADMKALTGALQVILADIPDIDTYEMSDDPRVLVMSREMARFHDTIWYPYEDHVCGIDEFMARRNPGWRVTDYMGSLPVALYNLDFETLHARDEIETQSVCHGKSSHDILNDPEITDIIKVIGERSKAVLAALNGLTMVDAIENFMAQRAVLANTAGPKP